MSQPNEQAIRAEFAPEFFLRELKAAARKGEFPLVATLLQEYEERFTRDAFYAESLSWVARSAAAKGFASEARDHARMAYALAVSQLGDGVAATGSPLELAAGAAIEVESQLLLSGDGPSAAIGYLEQQLARFPGQPFQTRIRKNLHLLALTGKPAPAIDWEPLPGTFPGDECLLKGPRLLFFWAHWCSDSRAQARGLAKLQETPAGSIPMIAPTRLFGYITKGKPAEEAEELDRLQEIRRVDYAVLASSPIPFGAGNLDRYGASTFPTLVGIRGDGRVEFFHAGAMRAEELAERLTALLQAC
ncbi:MAG: hypothetical protein U5J83_16225 [Bryobacterales bacterium]|nr:hypothetical protein [Bryobacterales bacterium]